MSERVTQWTVEALETRSMLSAVFGPPSAVSSSAQQSVIVDLDNDGVPDRVWAVNTFRDRRIGFEKGVGDGTFLAAGPGAVLSLPGTTSALVAGRFRGPTGGWQVASVGTYRDAGDVPGISRGLAVRVIDIGDVVGTLRVASRAFISWGRAVQVVTRVDALSGDVVGGEGQEIIVGASTIDEYPTGSAPVKRGRVTTHVLGLDARDRLNVLAVPMDRTFVASRERFLGLRTQVADVNNDGRLDVLTRPLTFWRLHAGPILRAGETSRSLGEPVRVAGGDESSAGGAIVFADATGDGLVDRVLVRTRRAIESRVVGSQTLSVYTLDAAVQVSRGTGRGGFAAAGGVSLTRVYSSPGLAGGVFKPVIDFGGGPTRQEPLVVRVGDVNGDGIADVALSGWFELYGYEVVRVGSFGKHQSVLVPLLGTAQGTFTPANAVEDLGVVSYTLADVNRDGRLDVYATGVFAGDRPAFEWLPGIRAGSSTTLRLNTSA